MDSIFLQMLEYRLYTGNSELKDSSAKLFVYILNYFMTRLAFYQDQ